MPTVGEIEKATQAHVVALFRDRLKYEYPGNWLEREGYESIRQNLDNQKKAFARIGRIDREKGKSQAANL